MVTGSWRLESVVLFTWHGSCRRDSSQEVRVDLEALPFLGPALGDPPDVLGSGSQTGWLLWLAFWPDGENSH